MSAEYTLKVAKLASARYLDTLPDPGLRAGARVPRPRPRAAGAGADPRVRYRRPVRRQVLLPRRARDPAAPPRRVAPGRDRGVLLGRPPGQGQDHAGRACSWSSSNATRRGSCPRRPADDLSDEVVQVDLNRPMAEIRAQLSTLPVKTRVSLTGPLVVARDIAHAKIAERLEAGEPMPRLPARPPRLLRRTGEDARGLRVRLVRADHRRPDGLLRRAVPGRRRLAGDAGEGQPVEAGDQLLRRPTAGSTSARSAGPPPGWPRTASARSTCWSTRSSAWRRSGRSRWRTSPPSSWWTTRATTSSPGVSQPTLQVSFRR